MSRSVALSVLLVAVCVPLMGFVTIRESSPAQDLAQVVAADDESSLARMSKVNGALMQRESHDLARVETTYGKDVECEILILKNLLASDTQGNAEPIGGMVFSVEEKYGSQSLYVDRDEVEGILAAVGFLEEQGLEVVNGSILPVDSAGKKTTEIHYSTRDGLRLGVFGDGEGLTYALKIGRTADWALLSDVGATQLKRNLEQVSRALASL